MKKYLILTFVCLLFVFDSKAQVEITSAGTSTAYTLNVPGVFPLRNGIQVTFKAHTACSASATMNVSGTGALAIMKEGNTVPLAGGDIKSGQIVVLAYDGTNWQMLSNIGNSVSVPATYWNLNGSDIYNSNGGNVGVGTPTPTSKLEVQSNANGISDALFLSNTTNADNYGARLAFRSQFIATPWSTAEISGIVSNGITQGSLIFSVMNNRATSSMIEAMRITGNGRVGIGTTNPAENLQISNANNANISLIGSASLSNKLYFGSTAFAYLGAVEYNNNDNSMNFWTNNTPNRIYIDNAGKVGIGNSAPTSTLHVTGNARITGLVGPGTVIADASGNLSLAAGTTITGSGTNNYLARWTPSSSQLGIGATYDDGTNVGIGTPVPAKATGANKYLTVSATDIGTTNASSSLEMVGNAGALNTMASRVDFLGVTPVTNVIYTRARIEARTGNGATGHGQLVFYTFNGTLNEAMRIRESGHIGIGGSPGVVGSPLSVGASSQFQIDGSGNLIRINNVPYSWPAANGSGFLSNNGSGTLTWSTAGVLAGGTTNYVPKWTAANALSSTSLIYDDGSVVGIGTATPSTTRLNIHATSGAGNMRLTSAATGQTASDGFSMSNDGSNNMYMTQNENADWYFNTSGGTLAMTIKPTGNIGIGTINAVNKLDVEGGAVIGANYSGTSSAPANGLLVEGNIGVGTTTTGYGMYQAQSTGTNGKIVTVSGMSTYTDLAPARLELRGSSMTDGDEIGVIDFIQRSSSNVDYNFARIAAVRENTNATYGSLRFFTRLGATMTEAMIIDENSNVGIGTSTPLFPLHVETSTQDRGIYVYNTKNTTNTTFAVYGGAHGTGSGEKRGGSFEAINGTGTNIGLRAMASGGTTNWAGYFVSGNVYVADNVGVGTTNPIYKIHAESAGAGNIVGYYENTYVGTSDGRAVQGVSNNASNYGYGGFFQGGYRAVYGAAQHTANSGAGVGGYFLGNNYGVYADGTGGSSAATVYGIYGRAQGTAGTRYGVYGTTSGTGGTAYYAVYSAGNQFSTTGGAWTTSDRKLKKNIKDLNVNALDVVAKIKTKQFEYETEKYPTMNLPKEKQWGFIAQEIQEVIPEMVKPAVHPGEYTDKGEKISNEIEFLSIQYDRLFPLLIKATQEQQAQIEELKKQLEEQKKKIEALEKK